MFAQGDAHVKKLGKRRIFVGGVISSYTNNIYHTIDNTAKASFNVGYKRTFNIFSHNIEIGLELVNYGLEFKSYYFAPGYSPFYDKTFPFLHTIRANDLQLPIHYKFVFGKSTQDKFTSFITLGWALRYMAFATTEIIDIKSGILAFDGQTDLTFDNYIFHKRLSNMLQASAGIQFNNVINATALVFDITAKYGLSPITYKGDGNSNNLVIRDFNVAINVGYRF